jgi:DNA polymerase IV (DinB-like DNA polymerase)
MHVDLDAFFASVEERGHPEYKGKPVIVGADPKDGKGRGVVSTCNYEARKFGVHSAMPISRAWDLCKDAIFLPVNYELYEEVSAKIMRILKSYAFKFEQTGIDEAFLDMTNKIKRISEVKRLAEEIKEEIFKKEKLTCSIGVGPNKLIAKIASDYNKPNGLTIVVEKNVKRFLAPLEVDKLWGIGKKTKRKMNEMGIRTINELSNFERDKLIEEFGIFGHEFYQMAHGIDNSEVIEYRSRKSYSREHTFESDTLNKQIIYDLMNEIYEEVMRDVEVGGFNFRTLTIKVRYENFETHTRSKTFSHPVGRSKYTKETTHNLLKSFLQPNQAIRLIGIRASNLVLMRKQKTLV